MTTARDVETARALIVKLRLPVFEPLVADIAAALSERERETVERCAKIAKDCADIFWNEHVKNGDGRTGCETVAQAIRADAARREMP